jgi:tRNA/tmRNA/rRNA uracil-C5-methylase (TrmA/RlmC/RlmD family)
LPASIGDETETTIERIVPGGLGLGYGGGRTLFVSQAAPGDRLRVRVDRERGRVAYASIVEVLQPGPDRVPVASSVLARCGADFQHLHYDAQLAAMQGMIADCLRRIGGIELSEPVPIHASPQQWAYRSRAEWSYDANGEVLGYREAGTHRVVDLEADPLVVPALADTYSELRQRLHAGAIPATADEIRAAAGIDGVSMVPTIDASPPLEVATRVGAEIYRYDAGVFFQANPFVLETLVNEALRLTPESGARQDPDRRLAIDLYCGVGLFTLPLARQFDRVIGLESDVRAAEFAARNVDEAGLTNVRITNAVAEQWLETAYKSHGRLPYLLLDPPRTGVPPRALHGIARLRPAHVTYVSCDPATLARDLKALLATDYELTGIAAIDMFPQTHHVEIVAHLQRAA